MKDCGARHRIFIGTIRGGQSDMNVPQPIKPASYFVFAAVSIMLYVAVVIAVVGGPDRISDSARRIIDLSSDGAWLAYKGDLPLVGGVPDEKSVSWQPLSDLQKSPEGKIYSGVFWVKVDLPAGDPNWRDPYIWVKKQFRYELYADGVHLGGMEPDGKDRYSHPGFGWRMYKVPVNPIPHTLLVRVFSINPGMHIGLYALGEGRTIVQELLRIDSIGLLYTLLFGIMGAVAIVFYFRSPKDRFYLSFACITFAGAAGYLLRSQVVLLFSPPLVWTYLADLPGVAGAGAFLLFLRHFSGQRQRIFQWLAYALFVFCGLSAIVALAFNIRVYRSFYSWGLIPLLLLSSIAALYYIGTRFRQKNVEAETGWVLTGMISAIVFVLVHLFGGLLWLDPYYRQFQTTFSRNMTRLARIREEHQLLTQSLERMVEARTAELEQANVLLEQSIRERSEAVAEMSVLQERNRIARDIHDVVGHTLTTTLVQIEAARRQLLKKDEQGLVRLGMSVELVRKSLADIRESVHLMQSAGTEFDLLEAIGELIRQTEQAAGVTVTGEVGELPRLSLLQKKVLFHAFQEGLTNGIKHGEAALFRYKLVHAEGRIRFTLWNNGKPFEDNPFGFGLGSMRERVRQLGGSVEMTSANGQDCVLSVSYPAV
jgi:signal transduction histidine kinase